MLLICANTLLYEKALFQYGKINGITPMRTHVESMHPKLVACRKLAIVEELVIVVVSHNQQLGKMWSRSFGCAITSYFANTNFYKKSNEVQ